MNIELTIDRFEGDKAVLIADDGAAIVWPKNKLPASAREGTVFSFSIKGQTETATNKKELAKEILNEILGTKD